MAMDYLKKSAEILAGTGFEGDIPFMYRDTAGWVTVGVGQMLPDVNAAKKYLFETPLGEKATADDIETDYRRVHAMPIGLPAEKYRTQSSLLLAESYIQAVLLKKLKECDIALRRHYLRYDTFPEPVKLALLDMIYNLGAAKLFGQFPSFEKAVNAQDWKTAADHSHRKHRGLTDNRNAWTRHQFLISEAKKPIPELPVHPAHYDAPAMLPRKGL
jgi:GH24 family phage-related lysozyme (muramidase)